MTPGKTKYDPVFLYACVSSFVAGALLIDPILLPSTCAARAGASSLVKLALFDFELEDFSAGAQVRSKTADDNAHLAAVTNEARELIAQSGRYRLVDTGAANAKAVKTHDLSRCNGCEASIAKNLGAEQSFLGVVTRISRTEYTGGF